MEDQRAQETDAKIARLFELLREPSCRGYDFYPEPERAARDRAECLLNDLVERLMKLGLETFPKAMILQEMEVTLHAFNELDSEEQDQLMTHLNRPLGILKIESTQGLNCD